MSHFVANIARRGAGLPPTIMPRNPAPDFDAEAGTSPEVQTDVMPSPKRNAVARPAAVNTVSEKIEPGPAPVHPPDVAQLEPHTETKERTLTDVTRIEKVERVVEPVRPQLETDTKSVNAKLEPAQAPIVPSSTFVPTRTEIEEAFEPSEQIQRKVEMERADRLTSPAQVVVEMFEPREPEPWDGTLPIAPERSDPADDSTEPKVEVHIGQIELRVHKAPPPRSARPARKSSLDDHAMTRSYLDRIY